MAVPDENTVTLITGPNRGIGHALLSATLAQPSQTVIAAVRDPEAAASCALKSLARGPGSHLIVVKIDLSSDTDPSKAVQELTSNYGIDRLDVVIANAGVATHYGPAATAPLSELHSHFSLNAVSVLALFQATRDLLKESKQPRFFACSSDLGSLALMEYKPIPCLAYGASKAALNFIVRKIHLEETWLAAVLLSPGWVKTDMGQYAAKALGVDEAPVTLEASRDGLMKVIVNTTRESHSGTIQAYDGSVVPW